MSEQNRNLDALDDRFKGLFTTYLAELERRFPAYRLIVTETLRTPERQKELEESGASRTLHSNHLLGRAIDIALQNIDTGEIDWSAEVYRQAFAACPPSAYGLMSGGESWGWDWPHLELLDEMVKYPYLIDKEQNV